MIFAITLVLLDSYYNVFWVHTVPIDDFYEDICHMWDGRSLKHQIPTLLH